MMDNEWKNVDWNLIRTAASLELGGNPKQSILALMELINQCINVYERQTRHIPKLERGD